jgi:hypothetical protein
MPMLPNMFTQSANCIVQSLPNIQEGCTPSQHPSQMILLKSLAITSQACSCTVPRPPARPPPVPLLLLSPRFHRTCCTPCLFRHANDCCRCAHCGKGARPHPARQVLLQLLRRWELRCHDLRRQLAAARRAATAATAAATMRLLSPRHRSRTHRTHSRCSHGRSKCGCHLGRHHRAWGSSTDRRWAITQLVSECCPHADVLLVPPGLQNNGGSCSCRVCSHTWALLLLLLGCCCCAGCCISTAT